MGQIGYNGTSNSLLASGIYGIVKVVATSLFVFFLVVFFVRAIHIVIVVTVVSVGSVVAPFVVCVLFQAESLTMEKTHDTGTDIQLVQRW